MGPMTTTGSPGRSAAHSREEPPISSTISDSRPVFGSVEAPVSASPSIAMLVPSTTGAQVLQVLQAVKLTGQKLARGQRRHPPHRRSLGLGARL